MAELLDVLTRVETVAAVNDDDIINIIRNGELYKVGADVFKGAPGIDGTNGANGIDGTNGVGVPTGGTTGQTLSKKTDADYDTEWVDAGSGGTTITTQPSAPASPIDGQLWIDSSTVGSGNIGVVDLTNATSDYLLQIGETATITYTAATSVQMHVITVEGLYEIQLFNQYFALGNNNYTTLLPNNTTYPSTISRQIMQAVNTSIAGALITTDSLFNLCQGVARMSKLLVNTSTNGKSLLAQSVFAGSSAQAYENSGFWSRDTTIAWTSLGTITYPSPATGKIVIRRII